MSFNHRPAQQSECKSMFAFFSLPVEFLGLAIVFISVMASLLAAAAE